MCQTRNWSFISTQNTFEKFFITPKNAVIFGNTKFATNQRK